MHYITPFRTERLPGGTLVRCPGEPPIIVAATANGQVGFDGVNGGPYKAHAATVRAWHRQLRAEPGDVEPDLLTIGLELHRQVVVERDWESRTNSLLRVQLT
jgi:hypothetical protein